MIQSTEQMEYYGMKLISSGRVPQSATISPILFNIQLNEIESSQLSKAI